MNKELKKVLTLVKYIVCGTLTAVVTRWLIGGEFSEIFIIGCIMAVAVDVADVKYHD